MANKRSKRNLSLKQKNKISFLAGALFFICIFISIVYSKPTGDDLILAIVALIVGPMALFFLFSICIFRIPIMESDEEYEKIKVLNTQHLSYTDFKQVHLIEKSFKYGINDMFDMFIEITQKEGCEFYAKLTEIDSISLICKDKHGNEIYSKEINDHIFFYLHFYFE